MNTAAKITQAVAFVGLGRMGAPMAGHLAAAGLDLRIFDSNPAQAHGFPGAVRRGISPFDAAVSADIVVLMLPDGTIMRDVLLGAWTDGDAPMVQALKPGSIVIDMGSSDPYLTRAMGTDLAGRGIRMIDAPVSGGVARAKSAELAIMAGGSEGDIAACEPLLRLMGKTIFHVGALGAGQAMKALNNLVSAAGLLAVVEALRIGERFGLDPERMVDVLNASTGRNNTTENKARQFMLSGSYASGFSMKLMVKDMAAALLMAEAESVAAPESAICLETWRKALRDLGDGADHTEIHRWFATNKAPRGFNQRGEEQET